MRAAATGEAKAVRVAQVVAGLALDDEAVLLLVLEHLAHVGEQRAGHEGVVVELDAVAVGLLEHLLHREAHPGHGAHVLQIHNVDISSEEGEGNLHQLGRLPAAAPDGVFPHVDDLLPQLLVLDLRQFREHGLYLFTHCGLPPWSSGAGRR
jgi:hypothetical protein